MCLKLQLNWIRNSIQSRPINRYTINRYTINRYTINRYVLRKTLLNSKNPQIVTVFWKFFCKDLWVSTVYTNSGNVYIKIRVLQIRYMFFLCWPIEAREFETKSGLFYHNKFEFSLCSSLFSLNLCRTLSVSLSVQTDCLKVRSICMCLLELSLHHDEPTCCE